MWSLQAHCSAQVLLSWPRIQARWNALVPSRNHAGKAYGDASAICDLHGRAASSARTRHTRMCGGGGGGKSHFVAAGDRLNSRSSQKPRLGIVGKSVDPHRLPGGYRSVSSSHTSNAAQVDQLCAYIA